MCVFGHLKDAIYVVWSLGVWSDRLLSIRSSKLVDFGLRERDRVLVILHFAADTGVFGE